MQTKQIKADGVTEYAFAKEWQWKNQSRYGTRERSAYRVVVLRTGVERRVYSSYSYGTRPVNDGVEIAYLDRLNDEGKPFTEVVRPAEIRVLWADWVTERDEARKAAEERTAQRRAEQTSTRARLDQAFALMPKAKRPWWSKLEIHNDGSMTTKGSLTGEELADLLEAAYAAGVTDGRAE